VSQTYENEEVIPIEAVYRFPLSEAAAICAFEALVDGRRTVGIAKEKEEAKREYNEAIASGKTATLLEQQLPDGK
jgi:von Willebrand factor A domain-containing protein 5